MADRPEIRSGWVEVVVKIDGASHLLGNGLFMYEEGEDAADFARQLLEAWDKSRDQAERTLRLFGAEGLARNLITGDMKALIQSRSLIQSQIDYSWKPNQASRWRDEQEREASNQESRPE